MSKSLFPAYGGFEIAGFGIEGCTFVISFLKSPLFAKHDLLAASEEEAATVNPPRIFISGQKRGVVSVIKRELRRRSAIEPVVCHMKAVRSPRTAKSRRVEKILADDHGATIVLLTPLDWRINSQYSFLADARIAMLQVGVR